MRLWQLKKSMSWLSSCLISEGPILAEKDTTRESLCGDFLTNILIHRGFNNLMKTKMHILCITTGKMSHSSISKVQKITKLCWEGKNIVFWIEFFITIAWLILIFKNWLSSIVMYHIVKEIWQHYVMKAAKHNTVSYPLKP